MDLTMMAYFWIAIGGAAGSVARFWMSGLVAERYGETFPWGTLVINVSGSFVIGLFGALTLPDGRWSASPAVRQLFMVGLCGGFTTFSSFSLQTLYLLRDREWLYAGGNALLSVVLCLIAVWLGFVAGAAFNSLKGS
jgi:CrcB protein